MKNHASLTGKIRNTYNTTKKWIVYANLTLLFILIYWGHLLGPVGDALIPAAAISTIAIMFETLESLETGVSKSFEPRFYTTIAEAHSDMAEIVKHDKVRTSVDVIGSSGGTTVSSILPVIVQASPAPIVEIRLYLVSPNSLSAPQFPAHWISEVQMVIERLQREYRGDRFEIKVYVYDHLPVISGVMINKAHLFLGFFRWRHTSSRFELSSADKPHRYFSSRKEPDADYFFDLFEDWAECNPHQQLAYQYPNKTLAHEPQS